MKSELKPYDSYKGSNVDWIGEIPSNWKMSKIKYKSVINSSTLSETTNEDYEIQYIDIGSVDSNGNIINMEKYKFGNAPSRARRIVKDGDTIVSTVRTYLRAITSIKSAPENLVCSTGFAVLTPNKEMYPDYLSYLIRSTRYVDEIVRRSTGVSYPAISSSEIGKLECIVPDKQLQKLIGNFLDEKTTEIDSLIADKEKLIDLLEEKRQAIITEAVTKGLNPNVKMKKSVEDLIGEIPDHWKLSRLDFNCRVKARLGWKGLKASEYVDEGYIFLSTPNIKTRQIDFENVNYITEERYLESPEIMLQEGDVLLAKDGSTLGTVNVVRELPSPATVNSSIAVLRPRSSLNPFYLYYFLSCSYTQNTIQQIKDGMGVPHLFQSDIRKFTILIPPIDEQMEISQYLDTKVAEIEMTINDVISQIEKLKEYRQALIYEAVTGKIDVRNYNKVLS